MYLGTQLSDKTAAKAKAISNFWCKGRLQHLALSFYDNTGNTFENKYEVRDYVLQAANHLLVSDAHMVLVWVRSILLNLWEWGKLLCYWLYETNSEGSASSSQSSMTVLLNNDPALVL
jgi:hypothetical protein